MVDAHVVAFALLSCWHVLLLWLLPSLPAVAAVAVACRCLQPQGAWCLLQGQGTRQPAVSWLLYPLVMLAMSSW